MGFPKINCLHILIIIHIGVSCNFAENIDPDNDSSQYAYGENIGWIHFQSTGPVAYKVKVCVVTLADLADFIDDWLEDSNSPAADLDSDGEVNLKDFNILTAAWLSYCPDHWPL